MLHSPKLALFPLSPKNAPNPYRSGTSEHLTVQA